MLTLWYCLLQPGRASKEKIPITNAEKILEILDGIVSDESDYEDGLEQDFGEDDSEDGEDPEYVPEMEEPEENILTCAKDVANEVEQVEEPPSKLPKRATAASRRRSVGKSKETDASSSHQSSESSILNVNSSESNAKSGKVWRTKSDVLQGKTPARNLVHIRPETQPSTEFTTDVSKAFELLFTSEILQEIVPFTNLEISKHVDVSSANVRDTSVDEINAVLSLLILSAALKNNHLSIDILFNETFSGTRYLAVMP